MNEKEISKDEIQDLVNTMPLEEMNDEGVVIENKNAEKVEGVGSTNFTMRTTTPYDNKQYITKDAGGWSSCIKGNPTQEHANVLANCVGYASGRFNEIIELARDYHACTYPYFNCNASLFVDRAIEKGFGVSNIPRVGSIMCWGGGYEDCGHVAVVERVDSSNQVYTSESDWGGTAFYNALRTNDNGRWGLSSSFYFKGFIYQEPDVQKWIDESRITPNVERDEYKDQLEVLVDDLRVRTTPGLNGEIIGKATKGFYNYYEFANVDSYHWYRIADNQWIAHRNDWVILYPAKPKEEYVQLKVLDKKDGYALVDLGQVYIKK